MSDYNENTSVFDRYTTSELDDTSMSRAELLEQLKQYRNELIDYKERMSEGAEDLNESYDSESINESDNNEDDSPDSIGQKVLSFHR